VALEQDVVIAHQSLTEGSTAYGLLASNEETRAAHETERK